MRFGPKETISEEEIQSGLSYVIKDGIASQSMGILTGGAFLIAFAIKLGASNFVIGLLAAIGPLSQLLQLPSIFLVEKIRNRRLITVVAAGLSRFCWLIIVLSPFLFPAKIAIAVLLILLTAVSAFGAVSGCSWNSNENRHRCWNCVKYCCRGLPGCLEKNIAQLRAPRLLNSVFSWFCSRCAGSLLSGKNAGETYAGGRGKTQDFEAACPAVQR